MNPIRGSGTSGSTMKIYTKTGDQGETGLLGGARVPKDHLRIKAYGTLDELNASLGVALSQIEQDLATSSLCQTGETRKAGLELMKGRLIRLQNELFQLGAELATPRGKKLFSDPIEEPAIADLESEIDQMESTLPPLKNFILPSGTLASSFLHLARTISRRAEREAIALNRNEPLRNTLLTYLNRVSDYLFVAARFANHIAGVTETPWTPRKQTVSESPKTEA